MDENAAKGIPFYKSRGFNLGLLWFLFVAASIGTYILSQNLESGTGNQASAFFGGSRTHEVELYEDRAVPADLVVSAGDEVLFVVRDDGYHNLVEERRRRGDARLESGEFVKGESYSLVFRERANISFYDRLNPDIRISIVIE